MSDFILVDPAQKALLLKILKNAPQFVRDMVVEDVADYEIRIFRAYPPRKKVTRIEAYGKMFKNRAQQAAVMIKVRKGEIPYKRTQTLRNGWKKIGAGEKIIIANEVPYGPLVMGLGEQARMMEMIGWEPAEVQMEKHSAGIDRIASAAAQKGLKKAGAS